MNPMVYHSITWVLDNPWLIFMVLFLLWFGSIAFSCWRDHRKQMKREADPRLMDEHEYRRFNYKRMNNE